MCSWLTESTLYTMCSPATIPARLWTAMTVPCVMTPFRHLTGTEFEIIALPKFPSRPLKPYTNVMVGIVTTSSASRSVFRQPPPRIRPFRTVPVQFLSRQSTRSAWQKHRDKDRKNERQNHELQRRGRGKGESLDGVYILLCSQCWYLECCMWKCFKVQGRPFWSISLRVVSCGVFFTLASDGAFRLGKRYWARRYTWIDQPLQQRQRCFVQAVGRGGGRRIGGGQWKDSCNQYNCWWVASAATSAQVWGTLGLSPANKPCTSAVLKSTGFFPLRK